jgi:two-component system CheB/CheR fusion protein
MNRTIRYSEAKLDSLSDLSVDAFLLLDENLNLMNMNDAGQSMFGVSGVEAFGKCIADVIPDIKKTGVYKKCRRVLKTGESLIIHQELGDRSLLVKVFKLGNGLGMIVSDITERKLKEQAIQADREYAENIINTVNDPLLVLDDDLRVTSASRSFYQDFKVTPGETVGQFIYNLGNQQWDIPRLRELLEDILPKHSVVEEFEVEHNFPSIGRRVMLVNGRQVYSRFNVSKYVLLCLEDITERKQIEEQLRRSEKLAVLGHLAGGVGHELRNPLGAIKNAAYFLNMVLEKPKPEIKETLEILDEEVASCEHIISSLLDFARQKKPTRRKVDIEDVIQETLSHMRVTERVEVVSQLEKAVPPILADPDQLSQVFGNIILNAIQAMPEGGQLVIKSSVPEPGWVAISFADTGVGIPAEAMTNVFEPLFTTKAKGVGLGLTIVKTLVEGHKGTIEVQSESGKGSTFTVKLPFSGG